LIVQAADPSPGASLQLLELQRSGRRGEMCLVLLTLVFALGGCGRVGFDELGRDAPAPSDAALGPCLSDDFDDGDSSDWTEIGIASDVMPGQGPDGSPALLWDGPVGPGGRRSSRWRRSRALRTPS